MHPSRWHGLLGGTLLAVGLAVMAYVFLHGGAQAGIFLIVPFAISSSPLFGLGMLLAVVGLFVLLWSLGEGVLEGNATSPVEGGHGPRGPSGAGPSIPSSRPRSSYGGFLFIGPVPVVFGNRPGWLPYVVALALVTVLAMLVLLLLFLA